MKKLVVISSMLLSLAAGSAFATGPGDAHSGKGFEKGKGHYSHGQGEGKGHHKAVPEIDAAGAALAIALLGGVVSIARERRKKS